MPGQVIADKDNEPDWIALDLLSQAEHDESAQSILITDDAGFGQAVAQAVDCSPLPPTAADVAAAVAYFASHDPPAESIPQLSFS